MTKAAKPVSDAMTSAQDEAAVRHAESVLYPNRKVLRPVDEYTLQRLRELSADDFKAGWDAGREELMGRIDAALALLKGFGAKATVAYDAEVCDLVRDVKLALTTEEQERE